MFSRYHRAMPSPTTSRTSRTTIIATALRGGGDKNDNEKHVCGECVPRRGESGKMIAERGTATVCRPKAVATFSQLGHLRNNGPKAQARKPRQTRTKTQQKERLKESQKWCSYTRLISHSDADTSTKKTKMPARQLRQRLQYLPVHAFIHRIHL